MLTIIHGDDITASRKFFIDLKSKQPDSALLDGEHVTLTDLTQALQGDDLFASEKTVFIDQLFSKRKASKELESIKEAVKLAASSATIYIWESKEVDRKTQTFFGPQSFRSFKLPQSLFSFLDSIRPGNAKFMLTQLQLARQANEEELLFFMLIRQFRLFLALHDPSNAQIDEMKRMQPWQKSKLEKQAKLFSPKQLKQIYRKLGEIDLAQKTGALTQPLPTIIDFFLLEI